MYEWDLQGSNLWPPACKADALPAELRSQNSKKEVEKAFFAFDLLSIKYIKKTTRMGFEPTTSAVTGRRSNQLSHRAIMNALYTQNYILKFLHPEDNSSSFLYG